MVGSSDDSAGLNNIAKRIRSVASDIVTVRTATVVTDYAPPAETLIALDNDPSQTPLNAFSTYGEPLPRDMRVAVLSYPPRGMLILGPMSEVPFAGLSVVQILSTRDFQESEVGLAKYIRVCCIGGGGGGGATAATAAGQSSVGSGGNSGGYAESILYVPNLTFPITATIGAGGGSAAAGGTTSFGSLVVATGGGGGQTGNVSAGAGLSAISANPGVGTVGDILRYGNTGDPAFRITGTVCVAGRGAPGPTGNGGVTYTGFATGAGASAAGAAGSGAGGGGGMAINAAAAQAGGAGASGSILIELLG